MPYPAYDLGLSAGGFVGPVSEAPPGNRLTLESNLNRSFSSFPAGAEHGAMGVIWLRSNREVMVVGEGLLGALRLALRVVACGNAFSLRSNRTLIEASHPSLQGQNIGQRGLIWLRSNREVMVVGEGFEPSKSMTADLQSAPFGRSGTPPGVKTLRAFDNREGLLGAKAPHPSGRCCWQRSLAFARAEP